MDLSLFGQVGEVAVASSVALPPVSIIVKDMIRPLNQPFMHSFE